MVVIWIDISVGVNLGGRSFSVLMCFSGTTEDEDAKMRSGEPKHSDLDVFGIAGHFFYKLITNSAGS